MIDFESIEKRCPLAWAEFLRDLDWSYREAMCHCNRFLFDFFDAYGLHINIIAQAMEDKKGSYRQEWDCLIYRQTGDLLLYKVAFPSRWQAEDWAFTEAFEMLQEELFTGRITPLPNPDYHEHSSDEEPTDSLDSGRT
jgi:hypothetical protein